MILISLISLIIIIIIVYYLVFFQWEQNLILLHVLPLCCCSPVLFVLSDLVGVCFLFPSSWTFVFVNWAPALVPSTKLIQSMMLVKGVAAAMWDLPGWSHLFFYFFIIIPALLWSFLSSSLSLSLSFYCSAWSVVRKTQQIEHMSCICCGDLESVCVCFIVHVFALKFVLKMRECFYCG